MPVQLRPGVCAKCYKNLSLIYTLKVALIFQATLRGYSNIKDLKKINI